jgi:lipopolysaccharide biosynthesis glycosyltransferase
MNKLKVFEYEHVFKYKKILFLDGDIVFNNDVNQIFDLDIEDHKYTR